MTRAISGSKPYLGKFPIPGIMRKGHRLVTGSEFSPKKKALVVLAGLPIFALILILPVLSPGNTVLSRKPSDTVPFSVNRRPPRLAYFISATHGDGRRVKRLLKAVYHPWNYYVLQLDLAASREELNDLEDYAGSEPVFLKFANVRIIGNGDAVTVKGPTMMSSTLHAAAILLRQNSDWSWFINLDASDYPLMSQDDLLHIFSFLPKDLNFVQHTSNIGWKEHQRARPIIVDPGLYGSDTKDLFWAKDRRSLPSTFKLFVGSPWVILSWSFLEFCVLGWDNLPRTLLMYYTNFLASSEGYFHTVICNSMDFQNTTVNHDLRFVVWDVNQPRQIPMNLTSAHFGLIATSGAPFARTLSEDSPALDQIDVELLRKSRNHFTPGGWCLGGLEALKDPCDVYDRPYVIRPSLGSRRLEGFLLKLLDPENFRTRQCK